MTTFDNIFRLIVLTLVALVGIVALALSYDALYLLASQHGHTGWKAYAWPALIDLPLVVFTLAMLYAQIRAIGRWTIASFLVLVLAYTGLTVYLNYLESDGSIEGIFVRVSAPVGLFVCTEVLRHLFKFEIDRKGQVDTLAELQEKTAAAVTHLENLGQDRDTLTRKVEAEAKRLQEIRSDVLRETSGKTQADISELNAKRLEKIESRRAVVLEKINAGWEISDIAGLVEVSERTVKNDLKVLNGKVAEVRQ